MSEAKGFIKLQRQICLWEWYTVPVVKCLFLHLLLKANFKPTKWRGISIQAGQLITSYERLASELGYSVQQIRTAISKLKATGEITSKSTSKYTLITLQNWELYQSDAEEATSKSTNKSTFNQQTNNKQITNNQQQDKNDKECIKNDKNDKEGGINSSDFIAKFNSICFSYPKVTALNDSRLHKIEYLLSKLSGNQIDELFYKAEHSDFLKGKNKNGWKATFDWLIDKDNYIKVLEGNYDEQFKSKSEKTFQNFKGRDYDFDNIMTALRKKQNNI